MATVAVDARAILVQEKTGVELMTLRLLEYWPAGEPRLTAYLNRRFPVRLSSCATVIMPPKNDAMWFHLSLPYRVRRDGAAIFLSPVTQFPPLLPRTVARAVIVYDLAYLHFPALYSQRDLRLLNGRVARSIQRADQIIAISENTKRDLQDFYAIPNEKIAVCYPAADQPTVPHPLPEQLQKRSPYILMVGTGYGRKNMQLIVPTLVELRDRFHLTPSVIITGKTGFSENQVLADARQHRISEQVLHLGYVDDRLRASLMANATALFFPSIYEGFGIPLLEAMHLGCPVVCSQTSSLPEVGGNAARYFDPSDSSSAAAQLTEVLTRSDLRSSMISAGHTQAKKFFWDTMAQDIRQALLRLL